MKITFLRKRKSKGATVRIDSRLFSASRDWLIGLLLLCIVTVGGGASSAYLFIRYSDITTFSSETTTVLPRYNQAAVSEVIEKYENRARVYESIKAGIASPAVELEVATSTAPTTLRDEEVVVPTIPGEDVPLEENQVISRPELE